MGEIQRLSIRHEAIMDYLMANPCVPLSQVAQTFGVTQPWLSQIIHSDAFQSMLKTKQEIAFHHTVLPLREKMTNIAHMALDKLAQTLPTETDVGTINKVAEGVLDRLGYSSKTPAVVVNNTQNVQVNTLRSELEEARLLLGKAEKPKLGVTIDGSALPIGLPALSNEGAPSMGEADYTESAPVYSG